MTTQTDQAVDLLIDRGVVITVDADRRIYNPGYVAVSGKNIVGTGPASECPYSGRQTLDASEMVVMPGIVNAHDHLTPSVYRSCFGERRDHRDIWLRMARILTRSRARAASALTLLELLHYGVTTTHESHMTHFQPDSTDGVCEAIQQSGMRAVVARSMVDREEFTPVEFLEPIEKAVDDLDRLEQEFESDRICIIPEASSIVTCTPEAVVAMRDWALSRGKIWHMHLAQGQSELSETLRTVGMGNVQYAASLGVLGPELLAAHCYGILDEEVDLLGRYKVRIAHCPVTVLYGGNRVPPIWELQKKGAIVALGTDSSATNNGQNPWEGMKIAVYMQRVRANAGRFLGTAEQALELATIEAARALGLDEKVGSLERGKQADIALFRRDQLHLVPDAMLVSNLVYAGTNNMADTVFVGGREVLRNGRSTVVDADEVVAQVREAQRTMISEAGLEGEIGLTSSWPVITG